MGGLLNDIQLDEGLATVYVIKISPGDQPLDQRQSCWQKQFYNRGKNNNIAISQLEYTRAHTHTVATIYYVLKGQWVDIHMSLIFTTCILN